MSEPIEIRVFDDNDGFLYPVFYQRLWLRNLWKWELEADRAGGVRGWEFPPVKVPNDYTFVAPSQENGD